MQTLHRLHTSEEASFYRIDGDYQTDVERYVVSTPQTRDLCNRPEILGVEYTRSLCQAVTAALAHAPFRDDIEGEPQHQVCVLNFLRGGLNFDLRLALHQAYGLNRHATAFMSSQRSRRLDGRWQVQEDMYRKLNIPTDATILVGDVVATGITLENGLAVLLDQLVAMGAGIRRLYVFTIGCHKIEKILNTFGPRFAAAFPRYQGSAAIYFEGKFKLVDSRTELRIGFAGTDLIRRDALLSPEFEASQWLEPSYPLERCTIYDAGSRAFDIPTYLGDVAEYWQQVMNLAREGLSLEEALQERWPHDHHLTYREFQEQKRNLWIDVGDDFIEAQYERYLHRWPELDRRAAATPEALLDLCDRRLQSLRAGTDPLLATPVPGASPVPPRCESPPGPSTPGNRPDPLPSVDPEDPWMPRNPPAPINTSEHGS